MSVKLRLRNCLACLTLLALCATACRGQIDIAPSRPFVPNGRWAFVVGVSNYPAEIGRLRYTAKEAREFAGELEGKLGFDAENVRLLADGGSPDETPTSEHILDKLDALLADKRLDKANLFVFYFSGHGVGTPKGDFLLPSNAVSGRFEDNGVPVHKVIERIVGAGLKNVLFIADACRAGTQNNFGSELIELCRKANIAVILGCAPGKRSYEYPQLQQGAFTHFLIESLNDPGLRDESGTLWASKVGHQVQREVHDYTEPDHGNFAQVPAIWAEQSTLDVLLATYPQPPISDRAVEAFKAAAEKLNRQEFASAMMSYADELMLNDRYDQCVELLKTVDQLGELTPTGRYLLALSLSFLGRAGEAERVFVSFQNAPDGYFKDLAYASCPSKAIDPKLRVKAAMRLFYDDPVWVDKMLAWTAIQQAGTYEQRLHVARLFAKLPSQGKRERLYAEGCLAVEEGRWRDAIEAFRRASRSDGSRPSDDLLFICQLKPTLGLNDLNALDGWIEEGLRKHPSSVLVHLEQGWLAKIRGNTELRLEALRAALRAGPDPNELWLIAKTAGPLIGKLKTEIKEVVDRNPYSWQARLVRSFLDQIEGDAEAMKADAAAQSLYRVDALTYNSKIFELLESMMSEAVMMKKLDELTYRGQVGYFFVTLLGSVADFGFDPDLWMELTQFGLLNERNDQMSKIVAKFLPYQPETMTKELRPMMLFLALNTGDAETVRRLVKASFAPTEGDDAQWLYASFLATQGRASEALSLVSTLRRASDNLEPRMEALKTYLLAKTGKTSQARMRLKTAIDDLVVRAFDGLAWASMGDWRKAEPLLAEQGRSRNWAFLFVSEYAMRVLDEHYRKLGRLDGARTLALSAAASQPGNPIFAKYSFVAKPGVGQFHGETSMDCVAIDDRLSFATVGTDGKKTYFFGKMSFSVEASGEFSCAFTGEDGARFEFKGTIDPLGNVTARGDWNGRANVMTGKIAPPALYGTFPGFKDVGQIFHLMDSEGYRVALVGELRDTAH